MDFTIMRGLTLLKITDFDKAKVLALHLDECMDLHKCAGYDYKVHIILVCTLYPDSMSMGQCQMSFVPHWDLLAWLLVHIGSLISSSSEVVFWVCLLCCVFELCLLSCVFWVVSLSCVFRVVYSELSSELCLLSCNFWVVSLSCVFWVVFWVVFELCHLSCVIWVVSSELSSELCLLSCLLSCNFWVVTSVLCLCVVSSELSSELCLLSCNFCVVSSELCLLSCLLSCVFWVVSFELLFLVYILLYCTILW